MEVMVDIKKHIVLVHKTILIGNVRQLFLHQKKNKTSLHLGDMPFPTFFSCHDWL